MKRTFERLNIIASVGFALAAGSAISLAVATTLFGSNDPGSMTNLKNGAKALCVAAAIYGLGFTSSVLAMLIPIERLELISPDDLKIVGGIMSFSIIVFLAPLWSVHWATFILGHGMTIIFSDRIFLIVFMTGTAVCVLILLVALLVSS